MTIVLTTHYLDEADSMAERVVVVDHGEVIADDTAEALKADLAGDRIVLDRRGRRRPHRRELAARLPGARDVVGRRAAGAGPGRPTGRRRCPSCCAPRSSPASRSASAQVHRPTLDDVFLALTGRSLRERPRTRQPADTAAELDPEGRSMSTPWRSPDRPPSGPDVRTGTASGHEASQAWCATPAS